ncbi:hypothetical protein E8E13_009801 [Curvularia kusanoi]|uniref:CENP-Q, a CENPA-CAD centromere complex subunit-domain-containing protein n=1 Tax=Curvularia kusanoi TaxID=90978 RepID=A0A9P4TLF0_CURKU|nr:hypothetical protein E8E13_009801 [Curvularia kusanoi]
MARPRADDGGVRKRRGRPPGSRNSGATANRVAKPVANASSGKKTKPKKKPHRDEEADELSAFASTQNQSSRSRQRHADEQRDEVAAEPAKAQKRYIQLETKTKRIPQDVIETWPHLSQQVLEQIDVFIKDAKKDIANTQRDERKVMAAHNSLNPLVKRLLRHLAASKIPSQARDYHFNIDKLTERNGQVFRDVSTARHSKQLLGEQIRVTQKLRDKDEAELDELRNDAKKWQTEWKHQQRHGRVHQLLRDDEVLESDVDGDDADEIRLKPATTRYTTALDAPDAELAPILNQLRRSLENMQGNHEQLGPIGLSMTNAQSALDDVLFRHSSAQQYATL